MGRYNYLLNLNLKFRTITNGHMFAEDYNGMLSIYLTNLSISNKMLSFVILLLTQDFHVWKLNTLQCLCIFLIYAL